ncbi:hypothetical protein EJ04DRAFT_525452 [Polyplosphaeria fusca]|uniref:Uncharacterized protein n=1 Tax=Polyplosphaeria fusca TaxID=682080 RepID=A0A9P4V1H8_9PLEO|nr:hypothetical protein EJ04DRAFT_525452 [Polyplosphaeria fusca]
MPSKPNLASLPDELLLKVFTYVNGQQYYISYLTIDHGYNNKLPPHPFISPLFYILGLSKGLSCIILEVLYRNSICRLGDYVTRQALCPPLAVRHWITNLKLLLSLDLDATMSGLHHNPHWKLVLRLANQELGFGALQSVELGITLFTGIRDEELAGLKQKFDEMDIGIKAKKIRWRIFQRDIWHDLRKRLMREDSPIKIVTDALSAKAGSARGRSHSVQEFTWHPY